MLTNNSCTIYHKTIIDRENKWIRYNYKNVWLFGGKGAGINKGYENANDINVRIPYEMNKDLNIANFSIGDIICIGTIEKDIKSQSELNGIEFYNITSITNNTFGNNKHIHLGDK